MKEGVINYKHCNQRLMKHKTLSLWKPEVNVCIKVLIENICSTPEDFTTQCNIIERHYKRKTDN